MAINKIKSLNKVEKWAEEERMNVDSIAEATHELRTPLAIMKGNIELIFLDAKGEKRRYSDKLVRNIDKEIDHLSSIISDLALLTSEGGQVRNRINREMVDISKLVNDTFDRLKNVNCKKNLSFIKKISKNLYTIGDSVYIERLVLNLVRNAITYGKKGGFVKVEAYKNKKFIEIKVSDNGIGISALDLPLIFNRFYRVDKSHNLNGKRTGLGLAIAKWVADVHGGSISVESELGVGSTFCTSLPIRTS